MATKQKVRGGGAVMSTRREPPKGLDYFPTPPWATRALLDFLAPLEGATAWEPAAGKRHMADVLQEQFKQVWASDVFDYGVGDLVGSFIGEGPDVIGTPPGVVDWVITNPPFNCALEFAERALDVAADGVALLVRTAWLEGETRHDRLFMPHPPTWVLQFAERVPMHRGRWVPDGDTMTAYCWVIWIKGMTNTRLLWLPPGCRRRCSRHDDVKRFAER